MPHNKLCYAPLPCRTLEAPLQDGARAGTGFRALLPSLPLEFGTNMPLRSRALVTTLTLCQEQPCPCRGPGLTFHRIWASWSTSCKMDSQSLANPPPTASHPKKQSTEPAQGLLTGSCRLVGAATPALGHGAAACASRKMGLLQLWAWQMWLQCLQQPGSLAPLRVHDAQNGWKHGCEWRGTEQLQGNVPLCSRRLLHLPTPSCWAQFHPRSINIW